MVAFKEEFPYLRCDSGQLFEFDRNWLHAAINRAADQAGYPSWWLTEHVTESIAFYLHLRNDENVVAFKQLQETVQYVLKAIGYKEIIPYFAPAPPPISVSLVETGVDSLQLVSLYACVKQLRCTRVWTRACDALREEIVCFIRERLMATTSERLKCSLR